MLIKLSGFIPGDIFRIHKNLILLYGDFNVLNFLYENKISFEQGILIYPDSTAVHLCLWLSNKNSQKKIVSTDLQEQILLQAIQKEKRLFFFGDTNVVLSGIRSALLRQKHSKVHFSSGYDYDENVVLQKISEAHPDILFVGIGHGRQETWISKHSHNLNVPLTLITGGWFRYLSGHKKRAPLWMRKMCLEWLYKLLTEFPRVWNRYLVKLPLFLFRIITRKIILEYESTAF